MHSIIFSLVVFLLIATILPLYNWRTFIVYGFRAQRHSTTCISLILALIIVLVLPFSVHNLWLFTTLILIAIINLHQIYPFFTFGKKEVLSTTNSENSICLLSVNVRMRNKRYPLLIDQVKSLNPDIVLLIEVDQNWIDALSILNKTYEYRCLHPLNNTYGMALYSKYPFRKSEVSFLVDQAIPSIHCDIVYKENQIIQFLGLHPFPPAPWHKGEKKDLELIQVGEITNINLHPTIVAGDLNDVSWSPVTRQFKVISDLKDPRVGRGFFNTYNVFVPLFRMPIDHVFVSDQFRIIQFKRLKSIGSDHYPLFVELTLQD